MKKSTAKYRTLSLGEEIFNSISHGIGALLSLVGLVVLVRKAYYLGDIWHLVSFSIFGASMFLLYLASTLYHSFTRERIKNFFARIDHASIFLLIAGTYTPFVLTNLRGPWGWSLFGVVWGLAVIGGIIRLIFLHKFKNLMVAIYLLMGWLFVVATPKILQVIPAVSLIFLVIGGLSYTIGVVFYLWRKLPYGHGIWHLFVLAGTITHFFAVLYSM
jgi:hemolysin III